MESRNSCRIALKDIIDELTQEHSIVLFQVISLCYKVQSQSDTNRMTASNLATVIGPNLAKSPGQDILKEVEDNRYLLSAVTSMIEDPHYYFPSMV